ncbi:MAG: hypothetical protein ACJAQT_004880 [Akkermansiaceae bacterium]
MPPCSAKVERVRDRKRRALNMRGTVAAWGGWGRKKSGDQMNLIAVFCWGICEEISFSLF